MQTETQTKTQTSCKQKKRIWFRPPPQITFLYFHEVIMELRRRHITADHTPKLYANLVFAPIRGLERENKLKMFDAASTSLVSFICKLLSVYVTAF